MSSVSAIGIDLGTTYSAVARMESTGRTSMVRNLEGELLTPSVVFFDQEETIVGREAKKAYALSPGQVAECAKRDMGSEAYSRDIGGQKLPPEVIQACILRKLRKDVVAVVGEAFKCVITVPAYFDEMRRKRTQDAGEMAGLDVLDIVNEPTAAALAYGEQLGYLSDVGAPLQERHVLVYDLGGGTFDVTLIQLKPGEITTLATDGDVHLGGYDWDARLLDYTASQFQQQRGIDPRTDESALAKLRSAVEEAKHTLTARDQASLRVDCQGQSLELIITRDQFEELTADLLERTSYTTRQVLTSAGLQWDQVDCLLLVGGSSRMPMVSKMLHGLTGKNPDRSVNPDEAVARGAAIFAEYLLSVRGESARAANVSVTDVNAHSLGIEGINNETLRKENVILIQRNTPLPAIVRRKFVTKEDNQRSIVVQVLEGESVLPSNCSAIGRAVIRKLPFGLPQGTRINVHYRYASNGRLSVHAEIPGTGQQAKLELEREQGLSTAGMNRWREVLKLEAGFQEYQRALLAQQQEHLAHAQAAPAASPAMPAAAAPVSAARPMSPIALMPVAAAPANPTAAQPATPSSPTGAGAARLRPEFASQAGMPNSVPQAQAVPAPTSNHSAPAEYNSQIPFSENASDARSSKQSAANIKLAIGVMKHVIASLLGLIIGYYILCLVRPESNFLNLPLPGVRQVNVEELDTAFTCPQLTESSQV